MSVFRSPFGAVLRPVFRSPFGSVATDLRAAVIAALFGDGEQGVFLDISDLSSLYQNSNETGPINPGDDGAPVGFAGDFSGNNNHFTQATTSFKPLYKTDGTLHWIEGDGFEDWMTRGSPLSAYPFTLAAAAQVLAEPDSVVSLLGLANTADSRNAMAIAKRSFDITRWRSQNRVGGTLVSAEVTLGTGPQVLVSETKSDETTIKPNGGSRVSQPHANAFGANEMNLFRYNSAGGTETLKAKFYGGSAVSRLLAPDELVLLEQWLATKSGVTL